MLRKDCKPLQRQLHEAMRIKNKEEEENLNSKSEYLGQRIRRFNLDSQSYKYNCNICGRELSSKHEVSEHDDKFHKRISCDNCQYIAFGNCDLKEHLEKQTCIKV